jgi:hypothetical protein
MSNKTSKKCGINLCSQLQYDKNHNLNFYHKNKQFYCNKKQPCKPQNLMIPNFVFCFNTVITQKCAS